MRLWARFRRWLHCLTHFHRPVDWEIPWDCLTHFHRPVDWEIPWGGPRRVGCECGRIFG
jgi:hypothetical protein